MSAPVQFDIIITLTEFLTVSELRSEIILERPWAKTAQFNKSERDGFWKALLRTDILRHMSYSESSLFQLAKFNIFNQPILSCQRRRA